MIYLSGDYRNVQAVCRKMSYLEGPTVFRRISSVMLIEFKF
jgi:hypothetical protein